MRMNFISFVFSVAVVLFGACMGAAGQSSSPVEVGAVPNRPDFATMFNPKHPQNRIGYRFHEHFPLIEGVVPRGSREAGIDTDAGALLERRFEQGAGVLRKTIGIAADGWAPQTWTFWLLPAADGVELLLRVEAREFGINSYYGVQQCFRMSGATNIGWRQEVARTPAFSEFDLWAELEKAGKPAASLTHVLRRGTWEALPARPETVGARTPLGLEVDARRAGGRLAAMPRVGPYDAEMLAPIDDGLITRIDAGATWVCGIYWERSSHVSVHHPADCLHSIVNIGGVPAHGRRWLRGKIYWFQGSLQDLAQRWRRDFPAP